MAAIHSLITTLHSVFRVDRYQIETDLTCFNLALEHDSALHHLDLLCCNIFVRWHHLIDTGALRHSQTCLLCRVQHHQEGPVWCGVIQYYLKVTTASLIVSRLLSALCVLPMNYAMNIALSVQGVASATGLDMFLMSNVAASVKAEELSSWYVPIKWEDVTIDSVHWIHLNIKKKWP